MSSVFSALTQGLSSIASFLTGQGGASARDVASTDVFFSPRNSRPSEEPKPYPNVELRFRNGLSGDVFLTISFPALVEQYPSVAQFFRGHAGLRAKRIPPSFLTLLLTFPEDFPKRDGDELFLSESDRGIGTVCGWDHLAAIIRANERKDEIGRDDKERNTENVDATFNAFGAIIDSAKGVEGGVDLTIVVRAHTPDLYVLSRREYLELPTEGPATTEKKNGYDIVDRRTCVIGGYSKCPYTNSSVVKRTRWRALRMHFIKGYRWNYHYRELEHPEAHEVEIFLHVLREFLFKCQDDETKRRVLFKKGCDGFTILDSIVGDMQIFWRICGGRGSPDALTRDVSWGPSSKAVDDHKYRCLRYLSIHEQMVAACEVLDEAGFLHDLVAASDEETRIQEEFQRWYASIRKGNAK